MKITIVQGAFFPVPPIMGGAVEKVWTALGKEFVRRQNTVTHISRTHPALPASENLAGVNHVRISGFDAPLSSVYYKLMDLIYSIRAIRSLPVADILITNTFWLPILVRNSRKGQLYVHVARYPKGQMRFYGSAARIQTVTESVAQAIRLEAPSLSSRVRVIPYPVITSGVQRLNFATRQGNRKVILFVGRVHPEKGVELLIRAYSTLSETERKEWRLVVVGSADQHLGGGGQAYFEQLKKVADGNTGEIEWKGPIFDSDELSATYRDAMLFVYPSLAERGETFGLAPLEAMANGCAPLVSNLECFRDYLKDGENGYVFDHRAEVAVKALAQKISQCIKNPALLQKMGEAAKASVEQFSMERVTQAFLDDFKSLVEQAPIGSSMSNYVTSAARSVVASEKEHSGDDRGKADCEAATNSHSPSIREGETRALRITLVLGHQLPFPPSQGGGVNQLIWSLAKQFTSLGHAVTVVSPIAPGLKTFEVDRFGITHRRFRGAPLRRGRWWDNLSGLPYTARIWHALPEADVTSFHAPFSFLLRRKKGLGVCTHTIHRSPKWILRLYSGMDRVYAGSEATVREAIAIAPNMSDRFKAIYNCIDCPTDLLSKAADFTKPCSLIYIGRFVPDKGLSYLIGGAIDAIKSGAKVSLTTIGPQSNAEGADTGFFDAMQSLVRREGMADKFSFYPSINVREQLLERLSEHEVFCLPSTHGETLSIAALEAMANGKPLLTSDYGPMTELVSNGVNGFTVRAGDRTAWANAIRDVCARREELVSMGQRSYDIAKRKFSAEAIANEYIADFRKLITEHR